MCECLGCSGCTQSRKGRAGTCNWPIGKERDRKHAKRCHWCCIDADTTCVPVVVADADTTHVLPVVVANANTTHVPVVVADAVTTHVPKVTSARPSHTRPLTVRLLTDSIGRLKSKGKEYIHEVQACVTPCGITIWNEIYTGGDLLEIADDFNRCSGPRDLNLIILMSNYAANTLGQPGISDDMISACHHLQKVAESVPTYVIYGGPGEMWQNVVRSGEENCFNTKTKHIRALLASSGHIKVMSGADDFRAFFAVSDLDDIGHIRGAARDKAIQWLTKQVMDASNNLCRVMSPNVQHGLAPVNDPLAMKFSAIGFPKLAKMKIPRDWLPRTLWNEKPHVFLLSGPDEKCLAQQNAASNMLKQLGWEPRLVHGIGSDVKLPHPRSHWAWACKFLPKMIHIIAASNCNDDDVLLLGEDSCWPTSSCTPQQVRAWMDDALRQGYQGIWIGACGGMRKRTFSMRVNSHGQREDQACEVKGPCGSKLFAITIRQLRRMEHVWGWVPQDWFVDGVNHLLAASGQLMIRNQFLAGSMQHFSMRCGKLCDAHLNVNYLGTLLPEGRSVEHVQTEKT